MDKDLQHPHFIRWEGNMALESHWSLIRSQRGASVVEFVIATPLVVLLLAAFWYLNNQMDYARRLAIATRNAVMHGAPQGADPRELVLDTLAGTEQDVASGRIQGAERDTLRVTLSPEQVEGSAMSVTQEQDLSYNRQVASQGQGVSMLGTGRDAYDAADGGSAFVADLLPGYASIVSVPSRIAGMSSTKHLRSVEGKIALAGSKAVFGKAIEELEKMATGSSGLSSRRTNTSYVGPAITGYHENSYHRHPLVSLALGFTLSHWNKDSGGPGHDSSSWLSRCMVKLTQNSNCENSNSGRDYLHGLSTLAEVTTGIKLILALVTVGGSEGFNTAINFAANAAVDRLADMIKDEVVGSVEAAVRDGVGNAVDSTFHSTIESARQTISNGLSNQLSSGLAGLQGAARGGNP